MEYVMVCVLVTRAQSWDCVGSLSTNHNFLSIYILSAVYFYIIVDSVYCRCNVERF